MKKILFLVATMTSLFANNFQEVCVENINLDEKAEFLYIDVCIDTNSNQYISKIKNDIIFLTSSKSYDQISSVRGKEKYINELQKKIEAKEVYLTSFNIRKYKKVKKDNEK